MSRIIKFRAWDGDKMHKAFDLSANPLYWWEKNYDFPLMQFTGRLDKNGVEIYEGDIVERQGGRRGKIIYYAGGFFWEEKSTELTPLAEFGHGAGMNYTVIGNIYESPKLCGW